MSQPAGQAFLQQQGWAVEMGKRRWPPTGGKKLDGTTLQETASACARCDEKSHGPLGNFYEHPAFIAQLCGYAIGEAT